MQILHEDAWLAVIDKPAGLMVHDSALARGDTDFVADRLRERFGRRIHLVHRLDRATSGCLLVCFDTATASSLGRQFMDRGVSKRYLAVCRGWPDGEEGLIDHPLDGGPGKPQRKPAQTRWRVLGTTEQPWPLAGFDTSRFALLDCEPRTGRFRQIRRHLKHVSHHLIGDTSHGDGRRNRQFRVELGVHRMLLHAWQLGFAHPHTGEPIQVSAPPDRDFERVFAAFGWTWPG